MKISWGQNGKCPHDQSLFIEEMHSKRVWEHGVNRKKLVGFTYELQS